MVEASEMTERDPHLEAIKGAAIGSGITVSVGVLTNILGSSRKCGRLHFPKANEINALLTNTTTLAVGAAFGYFGFKDAIRHNQDIANFRSRGNESRTFVDRLANTNVDTENKHLSDHCASKTFSHGF